MEIRNRILLLNTMGYVACVAVITGSLLKILHVEGSGPLLYMGLALFFFQLAAKSFFKARA